MKPMLIKLKKKKNATQNPAAANENLSSNSSIISDNNPASSENTPLIYCLAFSLHGNTLKNSSEILKKITPSFLRNIEKTSFEKLHSKD